jgi:hypothetical protein
MREELEDSEHGRLALKRIVEACQKDRSLTMQRESTLKVQSELLERYILNW